MRVFRRMLLLLLCLPLGAQAQKLTFRQAVELALKHSAGIGVAQADAEHAHQSYLEMRNAYIPQVVFGSGLANVWGYPMSIEGSAPSIFNISAHSVILNFGQRNSLRATRADCRATQALLNDQEQNTLLEAALTYIQLDAADAKLNALQSEMEEAGQLETISHERQQAGVDSAVDGAKASLNAARVRLRLAQVRGDADLLRQRLSQLTGIAARGLLTDATSLPPEMQSQPNEDIVGLALAQNLAVKAAEERAKSAALRAEAEHKQLYPAIDLVGNYGLFSKYNNLDLLFPQGRFSRNNATLGVSITVPFFNAPQRNRALAADADAVKAQKQADLAREQVANETLRLIRTGDQLGAARDVARLEWKLAQAQIDAVAAQTQQGKATIKDEKLARLDLYEKQAAVADAEFELFRARLQLLRNLGRLEGWALQ